VPSRLCYNSVPLKTRIAISPSTMTKMGTKMNARQQHRDRRVQRTEHGAAIAELPDEVAAVLAHRLAESFV